MPDMLRRSHIQDRQGEVLALEAQVARAGAALACAYSNSAELDAALIAARRAAGVYGPRRRYRQMLVASAGVAVGLAVLAFFVL